MFGTRISTAISAALLAASVASAQPDYFPLHVGNQWVYHQTGLGSGNPVVVEVVRADWIEGRYYSLLRGMPEGDLWLRMGEDGRLWAWNARERRETLYAAFWTPTGGTYSASIEPCTGTASVVSRLAYWKGAIGEFHHALQIAYAPTICADAGISGDFYLPYVGLVERSYITIAGPRKYELTYARLGGVTVISAPEVSFALSLDGTVYTHEVSGRPAQLSARLTLRNTSADPIELTFPSGQRFDLTLRNEKGEIVYRWSDGKAFTLALGSLEVGPGEKNFVVVIQLASGGRNLPPGRYVAEGWLTTMGIRQYAASAGLEIRAPR